MSAPSPLSPVRTTAARRVAVAAALGLGSAYAVAIVGYGFPLGLALADLFRDPRTPAPALWLERIAGPGMGPIWVCRAVALLLAVAALVAAAGLWRQAPWAERALRAWQIAGGLAAAVAVLLYLPPHPEHVLQVVLPWVLYVATVSYVATPPARAKDDALHRGLSLMERSNRALKLPGLAWGMVDGPAEALDPASW